MKIGILFLKISAAVLLGHALNERAISKESWLQESGYGLMFHYEAFKSHTPESYNQAIDSFNVNHFVESVQSTKAGHIIFVIGQHWGKYCAPNSAYEKLLGVDTGEWTSNRDLIMEIGKGLAEREIRLIIYMIIIIFFCFYFCFYFCFILIWYIIWFYHRSIWIIL